MDALFRDTVAELANYPMLGRPGKVAGSRELVPHGNYRLVYEINAETVCILALVHTARQWPPIRE
jgi:plasmid stabilization system protein ParE